MQTNRPALVSISFVDIAPPHWTFSTRKRTLLSLSKLSMNQVWISFLICSSVGPALVRAVSLIAGGKEAVCAVAAQLFSVCELFNRSPRTPQKSLQPYFSWGAAAHKQDDYLFVINGIVTGIVSLCSDKHIFIPSLAAAARLQVKSTKSNWILNSDLGGKWKDRVEKK